MKKINLSLLFFLLLAGQLWAQNEPKIVFEEIVTGLNRPVDIAHAGDSRTFIVEKRGVIKIMNPDYTIETEPFLDIRSRVRSGPSEMGLLGMAFHPDFANNGYFFLNYNNGNTTRVSRFRVSLTNVNEGDPDSEEIFMTVSQPFTNHNAGDIAFGPDSMLYITMGDGGSGGDPGNRSQNGTNLLGKILRVNVDSLPYTIPTDNPFVGNPNVADEVWSIGWRNPWRFSFDRMTGEMWVADVGQGRWEEVNVEPAGMGGLNYGWRCYEGTSTFNTGGCGSPAAYTDPIFEYDHFSLLGSSITGGFVYRGSEYPNMQGYYLVGDYNSGNVWTINKVDSTGDYNSTLLGLLMGRDELSSFGEDANGELYAASYNEGKIFAIRDTSTILNTQLETLHENRLLVFPQPALDILSVKLRGKSFIQPSIQLFGLNGQEVGVSTEWSREEVSIDVSGLRAGLYILKLKNQDEQWVRKIQVK
ncbi:MAG: PQQ-dependent sugar dehydrogenase [Bacteroidota bacterium]